MIYFGEHSHLYVPKVGNLDLAATASYYRYRIHTLVARCSVANTAPSSRTLKRSMPIFFPEGPLAATSR